MMGRPYAFRASHVALDPELGARCSCSCATSPEGMTMLVVTRDAVRREVGDRLIFMDEVGSRRGQPAGSARPAAGGAGQRVPPPVAAASALAEEMTIDEEREVNETLGIARVAVALIVRAFTAWARGELGWRGLRTEGAKAPSSHAAADAKTAIGGVGISATSPFGTSTSGNNAGSKSPPSVHEVRLRQIESATFVCGRP